MSEADGKAAEGEWSRVDSSCPTSTAECEEGWFIDLKHMRMLAERRRL